MIRTIYNHYNESDGGANMSMKNSSGGRPPGRKKTAKIEIVIEPEIKDEFMDLMRQEGKMASIEIGSWIKNFIKKTNNYE